MGSPDSWNGWKTGGDRDWWWFPSDKLSAQQPHQTSLGMDKLEHFTAGKAVQHLELLQHPVWGHTGPVLTPQSLLKIWFPRKFSLFGWVQVADNNVLVLMWEVVTSV